MAGSHKPHQSVKEGVPSADSLHQQSSCCSTSVLSKEETSTSGSVSKRQKTSSSSSSSSSLSKPTHQHSSRKGTSSSRLREESEGEGGKRKRIKLSSSEGIAKPITDSSPVSESKSRKSNRRETEEDQSDSDIEDKSKRQKIKRKESFRSSKGSKGKQHINKSTELKYVNVHVLLHYLTLYPVCVCVPILLHLAYHHVSTTQYNHVSLCVITVYMMCVCVCVLVLYNMLGIISPFMNYIVLWSCIFYFPLGALYDNL